MFTGRTDTKAEAPILWSPDEKSQLAGKDSDAGKDWKQKEKGATKDEMVGQHQWLNGREFEQTLGENRGQGSLVGSSPGGHRTEHNLATGQQQQQESCEWWTLSVSYLLSFALVLTVIVLTIMVPRTIALGVKKSCKVLRTDWNSAFLHLLEMCCCCFTAKSCLSLWDSMDCSAPALPVLRYVPEFAQTCVRWLEL